MTASAIDTLKLENFRSFQDQTFSFDPACTLITGSNGAGKTNILEAISLFSTGKSFRSSVFGELVRMGSDSARLSVKATVDDEQEDLSIVLLSKESTFASRATSSYQKNGVKKQKKHVVGLIKSVLFRPEDVEIIAGPASRRRTFLDDTLVQVSQDYLQAKKQYDTALRNRNTLILQLREGAVTRKDFVFWDQALIKYGDVLTRHRSRFIHFLDTYTRFPIPGSVRYDHSLMTQERLHQYAVAEVGAGKTLVGPHRDNVEILLALRPGEPPQSVEKFGSRGQQRMAIMWLAIAGLEYIQQETGVTPMLLLDDVFSELDEHNRSHITTLFAGRQVVLTTADPTEIPEGIGQTTHILL